MAISNEPLADVAQNRGHSPRHWLLFLFLLLAAAALVVVFGWMPRHKQTEEITQEAQARTNERPRVEVIKVTAAQPGGELAVPGTTLSYTEASIYARASGYVTRRLVDIGDHVRKGQMLAVIDSPDLDQQVAQAHSAIAQSEASLAQMEAQLHLAQVNWDRYKVLVAKGVFSRQDGDTQEANFRVGEANVNAAKSTIQGNRENLQRLVVLQQYERVTAPFSGVVTARNIDVGVLISGQGSGLAGSTPLPGTTQAGAEGNNAGASGSLSSSVAPSTGGAQGGAMFTLASLDPLRILVSVPEAYAQYIQIGQAANLSFNQIPGDKFQGIITRTSASIDQNTRTLLVEVQVRNPRERLMPGMYVVVGFSQMKAAPSIVVPGESIFVRNGVSMVAVVADNRVQFQPIKIGRDYGEQTEITGGLQSGDVIVRTLSDEVENGVEVEPQFRKQPPAQQARPEGSQPGQYGKQGAVNKGGDNGATTGGKK